MLDLFGFDGVDHALRRSGRFELVSYTLPRKGLGGSELAGFLLRELRLFGVFGYLCQQILSWRFDDLDRGHGAHAPTLPAPDGLTKLGLPVGLRLFHGKKPPLFDR